VIEDWLICHCERSKPAPAKAGEAIPSNYEIAALPAVVRNDFLIFSFLTGYLLLITHYYF